MTGEEIGDLVAPRLEAEGFGLYDVEETGPVLRVLVDRPGGIDIDEVAVATRIVSNAIDDVDALAGPATLEVSSPGLERPLRTPAHYAGAVGSRVSVKTVPGTEGARRFEGTLVEADDESFTVESGDQAGPGTVRAFSYHEVERTRTVFEWGGQPRPGGPKAARKRASRDTKASARRQREGAQNQRGKASS